MMEFEDLSVEQGKYREAAFSPILWWQAHATRSQARKAGQPTYFSMKACPAGHIERYVKTNCCAPCQRIRVARHSTAASRGGLSK